jgi:hypothetical protein
LPLGIGLASLQALTLGFLLVPAGIAGCALTALVAYWGGDGDGLGYLAAGSFGVLAFGVTKLRRAWKYRPSDAFFEDDRVRVEGGPHDGYAIEWEALAPLPCAVREVTNKKGEDKRWVLQLGSVDVAEADDPDEVPSFEEIVRAVRARVSPEPEATPADKAPELLACASCGAPVAPSGGETKCAHCDAIVAVPKDVRERVIATMKLSKQSKRLERLVGKLLDQPGAGSTTALLWVSFALIGSAWPLAIWGFVHLYRLHELSAIHGVALGVLPFLLIADGFFLSRLRLVDRHALATLTSSFGANPPAKKGDPLRCRSCMGPLRSGSDVRSEVVVECVFCGAANITGVDPRANARRAKASAESLEDALARRLRERRKWRWRTLASIPLFVLAPLVIKNVIGVKAPPTADPATPPSVAP